MMRLVCAPSGVFMFEPEIAFVCFLEPRVSLFAQDGKVRHPATRLLLYHVVRLFARCERIA